MCKTNSGMGEGERQHLKVEENLGGLILALVLFMDISFDCVLLCSGSLNGFCSFLLLQMEVIVLTLVALLLEVLMFNNLSFLHGLLAIGLPTIPNSTLSANAFLSDIRYVQT